MPRVLIVDDEPHAVELLSEFLTAKDYEVITASNGEEALQKVKEERPHLILLDVCMPKMSGLEVLAGPGIRPGGGGHHGHGGPRRGNGSQSAHDGRL